MQSGAVNASQLTLTGNNAGIAAGVFVVGSQGSSLLCAVFLHPANQTLMQQTSSACAMLTMIM